MPPPKLDKKGTLPGIFKKKSMKNPMILTVEQIRHRQSLTRPSTLKSAKIESGRLLSIVAKQALFGKHNDSSKAFLVALVIHSFSTIQKINFPYRKKSILKH